MTPYVVAVFNQKGGISKTTTSTNLAVCLAAAGKSVVVIDLDSQGDSTKSMGVDPGVKRGIYDIFIGGAELPEVITDTAFDNVRILPSTYNLAGIEIKLSELKDSQRTLVNILSHEQLDADYIVIDCPPALGILPINALAASNAVIIPVTATPYANDGLLRTLPSIKYIQEGLNKSLLLQGVLFTINDKNKTNRKINQLIRSRLGGTVYHSEIPRDTMVIEAASARLPVCAYAPNSPAAMAHLDFAIEFMERHHQTSRKAGAPVDPPPPRDHMVAALLRWRTGRDGVLTKPDSQSMQKDRDRLDKILYGDRTTLERIHLSMIHFFIEHRMWLLLLVGFAVAASGLLITFGLSSLHGLSAALGLS
jgi:chromosome partitioning protein